MRTLIVILLSFISLLYCQAQVLVNEGKLWSNVEYGSEQPDHQNYHSYWIKFQGDSTIHDTIYKKMFRSDDSLHTNWVAYGFLREDTSKKVFARNVPNSYFTAGEVMLYDFNLKKGDSINMGFKFYAPVDSVGYITLENKSYKTIFIASQIKWMEGIGSTNGIIWGMNNLLLSGLYRYLVCYSESDSLIYHNSDYNSCFVNHIYTGIQLLNDQKATFRLMKDNNEVLLIYSGEISSDIKLALYDITGKLLYNGNYNETRINLSQLQLPLGFYVFEATIGNEKYCGKVIL
jgi:hypothetical protein